MMRVVLLFYSGLNRWNLIGAGSMRARWNVQAWMGMSFVLNKRIGFALFMQFISASVIDLNWVVMYVPLFDSYFLKRKFHWNMYRSAIRFPAVRISLWWLCKEIWIPAKLMPGDWKIFDWSDFNDRSQSLITIECLCISWVQHFDPYRNVIERDHSTFESPVSRVLRWQIRFVLGLQGEVIRWILIPEAACVAPAWNSKIQYRCMVPPQFKQQITISILFSQLHLSILSK